VEFSITSEKELDFAAKKILEFAGNCKIILFNAEMGAGKTTLIKALCKALKSQDKFSSPTYSIVNEYTYPDGKIFHFDLYRLTSIEELMDIGFETYIDSNHYCFIEWPSLASEIIDSNYLTTDIKVRNNFRYISLQKFL
jgi:tRNA threonylcarbamoyladenosine biosynthesis protein TsaE